MSSGHGLLQIPACLTHRHPVPTRQRAGGCGHGHTRPDQIRGGVDPPGVLDEGVAALERALSGAKGSPQVVCDRLIRSLGVTAEHDDDVAVLVVRCTAPRSGP